LIWIYKDGDFGTIYNKKPLTISILAKKVIYLTPCYQVLPNNIPK